MELGSLVQLEAQRLLQAVTSSAPDPALLAELCTRDTLHLLLKSVCGEGRARSTGATILTSLLRDAWVTLKSGQYAVLLLALVIEGEVKAVAGILVRAGREEMGGRIDSLELGRLPGGGKGRGGAAADCHGGGLPGEPGKCKKYEGKGSKNNPANYPLFVDTPTHLREGVKKPIESVIMIIPGRRGLEYNFSSTDLGSDGGLQYQV